MALGKAFIEVHADTAPFARELGRELTRILATVEKTVVSKAGTRAGQTIGEETAKGIRSRSKGVGAALGDAVTGPEAQRGIQTLLNGLIDTLDDGLSGLPKELKAGFAASLVVLLPVAIAFGAALAAAIVSGLTLLATGGIGALVAAQFVEVQDKASQVFRELRQELLQGAADFVRPFLNALDLVRDRIGALMPEIQVVLAVAGQAIVPLADAFIGLFEGFLPGFKNALREIDDFFAPLQIGFRLIGQAAGQFFDTILNNGSAPEALYDLLIAVEDLIQIFTFLVDSGLEFYGVLRDIFEFLGIVNDYEKDIEGFANAFGIAGEEIGRMGVAIRGTIPPTEEETAALVDFNAAIKGVVDAQFAIIGGQIAFERGLRNLTQSVKDGSNSLSIYNENGARNAEILLELARNAIESRARTIELTQDTGLATVQFEANRAKIYQVAASLKLSREATDALIKSLLDIPPPKPTGVTGSTITNLKQAISLVRTLISILPGLGLVSGALGAIPAYADGGIVSGPTVGLIGEAGAEAVIPLTNPARAAQLLNQSGLSSLVSPSVSVYIGNQQIDAYIDQRVGRSMAASARSLAYGTREV